MPATGANGPGDTCSESCGAREKSGWPVSVLIKSIKAGSFSILSSASSWLWPSPRRRSYASLPIFGAFLLPGSSVLITLR